MTYSFRTRLHLVGYRRARLTVGHPLNEKRALMPSRQRRKIHIKREKSNAESRANDARSVEYVCSLPASFSHPSFCLSPPPLLPLPAFSFFFSTAPLSPLSFFFILNTLREEMLLHARSRGEDVPLTAYTNPRLPRQPGELFPFRFPIPLQLALSKRVRGAASFVKAVLRFPALISGTISSA